jgi:hypothetical protein
MTQRRARFVATAALLASGLVLAGCMTSPTYGTGTRADEQLLSDVTGILSIAPKDKEQIEYKPRPDLVKPASTEIASLPAPQQSVMTAGNPAWPESPEQMRKRLRDEATANQDNAFYSSSIESDIKSKPGVTSAAKIGERGYFESGNTLEQRAEFNKRLAETKQGSSTTRKYLSEPPLVYRAPSETAPVGDVGEDEWKKERRQKKAARKERSWRDLIPTL